MLINERIQRMRQVEREKNEMNDQTLLEQINERQQIDNIYF